MNTVLLDDFSGGIAPDGVVSSERQVLDAHGFVLDDQARLRTQMGVDRVGTLTDVKAVDSFITDNESFLVAVQTDGTIWWCLTPQAQGSASDANAAVWEQVPVAADPQYLLITQFRHREQDGEYVAGFYISCPPLATGSSPAVILSETDTGSYYALKHETISDFYPGLVEGPALPDAEGDPPLLGAPGKAPRASVGCMWDDFFVLADIEWSQAFAESGLGPENVKRYANYLWIADPLDPTAFDSRYPVRGCEEGAEIVGLMPTEQGLFVFSTAAGGQSGITLLRGTGADYTTASISGDLDKISELSPVGRPSYWADRSSMLFTTSDARLWEYNVGELADLTPTLSAAPPGSAGIAFACGRWILFSDPRQGWLWIMRSYGSDGGWTRLNTADLAAFASPCESRDNVFCLFGDRVFRIRTALDSPSGGRGVVDGSTVVATVRTSDIGERSPFDVMQWNEVGLVFSDADGGVLSSVNQLVRLPSGEQVRFDQPLSLTLAGRSRVPVFGAGDSPSFEVEVRVAGDATLSQVEVRVSRAGDER